MAYPHLKGASVFQRQATVEVFICVAAKNCCKSCLRLLSRRETVQLFLNL